ncbi:MAG: helix-turn-helix domain-containing protein [Anaerolineales bacterium]
MAELTRRQSEFLSQFLDQYRQANQSLHYTDLAEALDLGKITVYEMLRLLEERGYVRSEYHLPEGDRGPGRSTVHFRPTQRALALHPHLEGEGQDMESWEEAADRILAQLERIRPKGYETYLQDLIDQLPKTKSPSVYLTEMSTAIILALGSLKERAEASQLLKRFHNLGLPGEIDLSALPGIGISLGIMERANKQVANFLAEQSGKYHTLLEQLGQEKQRLLREFTRQVSHIVFAKRDPHDA